MKKTHTLAGFTVATLFAFSPLKTWSQNLIQYGSFETWAGTFQNWRGTYGRPGEIINDADGDGGAVTLIDQTPMYQIVPTLAGITYHLTFSSRAPQPQEFSGPVGPNGPIGPWQVNVYTNGFRLGVFENNSQTTWQYFSVDFVATGATTLGFGATINTGYSLFDDVSLVAVPEPKVLLFLALLATLGGLFKKAMTKPPNGDRQDS